MKAFVVLDEGYINQAVVSLSSFFKYNRIELIIYAEKNTDLTSCRLPFYMISFHPGFIHFD